jgi:hypothetical protein
MTDDMPTPTTPETALPQWTEHLPVISKELDEEITKELEQDISILKADEKKVEDKVKELVDGKSAL